jgi:hypothetical protein
MIDSARNALGAVGQLDLRRRGWSALGTRGAGVAAALALLVVACGPNGAQGDVDDAGAPDLAGQDAALDTDAAGGDAADAGDAPLARDGDGAELPLAADAVDGGGPDGVTVVCEPAARWEAGAPLFDEVTEAWGLRALESRARASA